jgi:HlyD family secretion protein
MQRTWLKRALVALVIGIAVATAVWIAWPRPIPVDIAAVAIAPMEVTVEDEARTRVRHVYTVSAPIAGKVLRTPRHVGDEVVQDETVVAVMEPTEPGFLDLRTREELREALAAAEAAVELAEHEVHRIEAAVEFARTELQRTETLARREVVASRTLDQAQVEVDTTEHALASARSQLAVRRSERAAIAA